MNNKKSIIALLLVAIVGIVGLTIAYFSNQTTIDNEFKTKSYGTTYTEEFVSPDNWLPGTTTTKTIVATNSGQVDEAVRISFTESWTPNNSNATLNGWIHADGTKSTHTTESELANDERVAVIDFDNDSDWDYEDGYYYYKYKIAPGETTSSLIKSVTFNAKTKLDDTCTTTEGNGTKTITCNSSGSDYDHATYTLTFTVETVQYDKYAEAWELPNNTTIAIGGSKPQAVNFAQAIMSKSNAASITNYTDGVTTEAYTFNHDATEQTPALTDYRYIGASPNNYVEFNCDDNGENCEVWRAIGVFYVDDGNDNWEWRVKLVRGYSLSNDMKFDTNGIEGMYEVGGNNWNDVTLRQYLNNNYYDNFSNLSKNMIANANYYLGQYESWDYNNSAIYYYNIERNNKYSNWNGKIGLIYPSDYIYNYSLGIDNICFESMCTEDNGGKPNSGWIYNTNIKNLISDISTHWTMTVSINNNIITIEPSGLVEIDASVTNCMFSVRPTLYLSSSVKTTSGDGSVDSPYKLSL